MWLAQGRKHLESLEPKRKTLWALCCCVPIEKLGLGVNKDLPSQSQVSVLLVTQVTCLRQHHTLPSVCSILEQSAFKSYTTVGSPPANTQLFVQSQAFWGLWFCPRGKDPECCWNCFYSLQKTQTFSQEPKGQKVTGLGVEGGVFQNRARRMALLRNDWRLSSKLAQRARTLGFQEC